MSIPNENASWCKFCGSYSNSGFEICDECFERKLKNEKNKIFEEIEKETDKWIKFERIINLLNPTIKTQIWNVIANETIIESGVLPRPMILGQIKWYPAWRHYCFFPNPETLYSDRCLLRIGLFVEKLNDEHKENLKRKEGKK